MQLCPCCPGPLHPCSVPLQPYLQWLLTSRRRTLAVLECPKTLCQCSCAFAVQSSTMYSWYALRTADCEWKMQNMQSWKSLKRSWKWVAGMSGPIARQVLRNTSSSFRCRDPLRFSVATPRDFTASDRTRFFSYMQFRCDVYGSYGKHFTKTSRRQPPNLPCRNYLE